MGGMLVNRCLDVFDCDATYARNEAVKAQHSARLDHRRGGRNV
jgi:hypothetical protein